MRLFVAIRLPDEIRRALASIQPGESEGIRLVRKDLLHLTLQFIGEADVKAVASALAQVKLPEKVTLKISETGAFRGRRGMTVLWAGVEPSPGLLELQESVAGRLRAAGFVVDEREYRPHLTLARCRMPKGKGKRKERLELKRTIESFLEENVDFELPA